MRRNPRQADSTSAFRSSCLAWRDYAKCIIPKPMARWPATLSEELTEGTMYVTQARILNELERRRCAGQGFKFRTRWVCYQPNRLLTYRNLDALRPENREDFEHIMASCRDAGMDPPSSFAA